MDTRSDPVLGGPSPRVVVVPPAHLLRVPDRLAAAYWLMLRAPQMPGVARLRAATRVYRLAWGAQLLAVLGGFLWLSAAPQALLPAGMIGLATLGATMAGADPDWEDHRSRWSFPLRAPRATAAIAAALALLAAAPAVTRGLAPWFVCLAALGAAESRRGRVAERLVRELGELDAGAVRAMMVAGIASAPPDAPLTTRAAGTWPVLPRPARDATARPTNPRGS
jgi:hypothetical protein